MNPSADFTDKDFDSVRARLYALVASVFPEWTDRSVANFGNTLVDLFAHVADLLLFYQDNHAAEAFIATATQRASLLKLARLLGYRAATATAATADLVLTLPAALAGDVVIAAGDRALTAEVVDPIAFQALDTVTLPAGATSLTITVENSDNAEETFSSTGLPNQAKALASVPYLDDSAVVVDALGSFTQVANFLGSTSGDRHFVVEVDQNERANVLFGNGVNGAVPVGDVTIFYKTGGGAAGNVPATAIKRLEKTYTDTLGNPANFTVTNPAAASGGAPRTSNEEIRERAPEQVRAEGRSIAREDFVINARRLPQVARALFLTKNEDPAVPENTGILYVIPKGGGYPSTDLKALAKAQVTTVYPCPVTFTVLVQDPAYKVVNIAITVYLAQGSQAATVKARILAALAAFFALTNADGSTNTAIDFGANILNASGEVSASIAWSDLFNVVRDVAGVRKVDASAGLLLNGAREDVPLTSREFPTLGDVTIRNGETGALI